MNEMIFNGVNFTAFDAYYATSNFLDGAAKDYTSVSVLGRSGDLQISNNRYKNITVKVRVYVRSNMEQNIRAMRSYLESVNGYARLELSDQPNEYRIGLYKEMFVPSSYDVNVGVVDLTFDCKPQRFLKSGEIPVPVSPVTETTSGNPAVIDNMSNLVQVDDLQIAIEPVQDLHGYDSPWVGGAGKNLFDKDVTTNGRGVEVTTTDTGFTVTATATGNNNYARFKVTDSLLGKTVTVSASVTASSTNNPLFRLFFCDSNGVNVQSIASVYGTGDKSFTATIPSSFPEGATQIMVFAYAVTTGTTGVGLSSTYNNFQIEIGSTVTDWVPYENVCPITGHTSATVTSALKNLLQNTSSSSTNHGITFTKQSDSTVVANGTADGDASFIINFTWDLDDGDYQLSGCAEGGSADKYYCFLWDRSANTRAKDWDGNASESSFNPTQIVKVRLEHGVNYGFYLRVKAGVTVNNITFYPMICAKYHGTVYIKYTAKTATIDLGGTRYGGSVDLTTGVLTVTHAYIDLGELNWGMNTANNFFYGTGTSNPLLEQLITQRDATGIRGAICEAYFDDTDFSALANLKDGAFVFNSTRISSTKNSLMIKDTRYTDATNFKTAVNGVHFVAELATPQTYQLTPSILKLSSGVTYNFADTGRIVSIRTISPATLTNPTRFDSKPIIRVWGNGTLNVNSYYITVANSPYDYIDIDCELMDCYHGSNNANQYVTFSTTGFVTLNSGANYFGYSGFSGVHVIPRWYEV